ncbi:solute carrier family 22 member 21-like [Ornithodoros turicata]|uniref:solute carrier family 22 member 21-like n=1 Tax=Ornithodoros turicata TaxID=34597 RepID=UPI003139C451
MASEGLSRPSRSSSHGFQESISEEAFRNRSRKPSQLATPPRKLSYGPQSTGSSSRKTSGGPSSGIIVGEGAFTVLEHFEVEWRAVLMIFMVFTVVLSIAFYQLEESPRWLMCTFNFKRAERAVLWAGELNKEPLDSVRKGYAELKDAMLRQFESYSSLMPTPLHLLKNPELRMRCTILGISSFTVLFSYYGLSFTQHVQVQYWARIVQRVSYGPLAVVTYVSMNWAGRKTTFAIALIFLGGSCTVLTVTDQAYTVLMDNALLLIARGSAFMAIVVQFVYTAELFPTIVRSIGVCGVYTCGQLGATAAALTASHVLTSPKVEFVLVGALVLLTEVVLLRLPETQSMHLANTIRDVNTDNQMRRQSDATISSRVVEDTKELQKPRQPSTSRTSKVIPVIAPEPPSRTTFVKGFLQ